jgi:TctA family transporter
MTKQNAQNPDDAKAMIEETSRVVEKEGLRQSLMVSNGSWAIFFAKPISAVFLGVTALIVIRKAYVLLFRKDVA